MYRAVTFYIGAYIISDCIHHTVSRNRLLYNIIRFMCCFDVHFGGIVALQDGEPLRTNDVFI